MDIRLTQIDGKLPNLALMKLAFHHRARGDQLHFSKSVDRDMLEPRVYDRAYGSAIFSFSAPRVQRFREQFPEAIVGGTWNTTDATTVETLLGVDETERYDYSIYPGFTGSIGFTARGCRLKCGFCLMPGSMVITGDGLKPIEKIQKGDLVLTHKGRYRKVVNTMSRPYVGNIYRLRSGAVADLFQTWVTPEHPVLTDRIIYASGGQRLSAAGPRWLEAGYIREGNLHRSRDVFVYPRTNDIDAVGSVGGFAITKSLMSLLGWYVAEGYLTKTPRRGYHRTTFCLGFRDTEMQYARDIQKAAAAIGLRAKIYTPKIGIRVVIESVKFARWLLDQFGTGASTKKVPLWIRRLPTALKAEFIDSWNNGDGWKHIKRGSLTFKTTTVSPHLAIGLREIALSLGYYATINTHQSNDLIQDRKVAIKPSYTVIYHQAFGAKKSIKSDGDNIYPRMLEPDVMFYDGQVHDIEVEEDHSFCTPGFAVHNCVVPKKEGKPRSVNTIAQIWRGEPYPKHLHLLDNDFFGQPREQWEARLEEIRTGGFKVCLNQGINIRMIDKDSAAGLASIPYYDDQFKARRLYTAWDNIGDEQRFFKGVSVLREHGIPPTHLMVYMLIGYDQRETWERVFHRFNKMIELGIRPYPMVYGDKYRGLPLGGADARLTYKTLGDFQRWVIRRLYQIVPFEHYDPNSGLRNEGQEFDYEDH